jgi:ATP-dependent DNA ligase
VSDALEVPASAVKVSSVDGRRKKRALLSFVSTSSIISVTSGMTSRSVLEKLRASVTEGTFLTSMQLKSGLPIISMSPTTITDTTPITQLASEPTASPVADKGMSLQRVNCASVFSICVC